MLLDYAFRCLRNNRSVRVLAPTLHWGFFDNFSLNNLFNFGFFFHSPNSNTLLGSKNDLHLFNSGLFNAEGQKKAQHSHNLCNGHIELQYSMTPYITQAPLLALVLQ